MPRTIFLTGASGFVGNSVLDELLARGYLVHALVNHKELTTHGDRVKSFPGGLFDPKASARPWPAATR